ncbi:MAG: hypothetical protein KGD63_14375 [Candidatus Lokiarchaeota archaeon]|nr:hypothetical protein [Candidatus Lokiarchaeota archaeon]
MKVEVRKTNLDKFGQMTPEKAKKYMSRGIIITAIFLIATGVSVFVAANADEWEDLKQAENQWLYDSGVIDFGELGDRNDRVAWERALMEGQSFYVTLFTRIGIYIGFFFLFIGLVGFAITGTGDERTKRLLITIASLILFVMIFTILFSGFSINMNIT